MSAARQNSNVFAMFDQKQIAELKEAFSFIDSNNDGLIDNEDLTEIWASLGTIHMINISMICRPRGIGGAVGGDARCHWPTQLYPLLDADGRACTICGPSI